MDGSGFAVGMGAGLAFGIGTGRKAAVDAIRKYAQANHLTIQRAGSLMSIEDFLAEAAKTEFAEKKKPLAITILVLGVLMVLGILLYLYTTRGESIAAGSVARITRGAPPSAPGPPRTGPPRCRSRRSRK